MKRQQKPYIICHWKKCDKEALYPAPKNYQINQYIWFCLEHIREYNLSWNYYQNIPPQDIETLKMDYIFFRKTTPIGVVNTIKYEKLIEKAFYQYLYKEAKDQRKSNNYDIPQLELEALRIMDLHYPTDLKAIKIRYKQLAKIYHPDMNNKEEIRIDFEDKFKKISQAYKLLIKSKLFDI